MNPLNPRPEGQRKSDLKHERDLMCEKLSTAGLTMKGARDGLWELKVVPGL